MEGGDSCKMYIYHDMYCYQYMRKKKTPAHCSLKELLNKEHVKHLKKVFDQNTALNVLY